IPDAGLGEVGRAFVVARTGDAPPDDTALGDEIIAWCRDEIANYKVPRVVTIVTELPLNATGKVEKNLLREQAAQSRSAASA
ncbi:MAG: hypothetical protein PV358_16950, partial [Acidimicrobiales bacterium]|nr:hypothetical protein [Acidimicrobiales bacterium]